MDASTTHMQRPVRDYATQDFVQLRETMRVDEALRLIRHRSTGQTLIYFYVVDAASRLAGVLQTRALLAAQPDERLSEIMIQRVVAIPETATVLVAVQSLALVLEAFRIRKVTLGWYIAACRREMLTALPLALAAGLVVFTVVLLLERAIWPAAVISGSLALGVGAACLLGISIPTLLHVAKLDLTIAAGPITLAVTDVVTLLLYLSLSGTLL